MPTAQLHSTAGPLEAIYRKIAGARAAAVLCHSHPEHGGSMYDPLLHRIACGLHAAGVSTLRFNFRGTGGSAGRFDGGAGEQDDVRAALDLVARDHAEVALVGFSFGAWVGLRVGADAKNLRAMVGIALPSGLLDCSYIAEIAGSLLLIQGEHDEWGPPAVTAAHMRDPQDLMIVPGAGHHLREHHAPVAAAVVEFLR